MNSTLEQQNALDIINKALQIYFHSLGYSPYEYDVLVKEYINDLSSYTDPRVSDLESIQSDPLATLRLFADSL